MKDGLRVQWPLRLASKGATEGGTEWTMPRSGVGAALQEPGLRKRVSASPGTGEAERSYGRGRRTQWSSH